MSGIFTAFSQGYERFQHLTDKEMEYALENCVSKGTPVIVLLQYPDGVLHYVPVTGYDKNYIYIQESVPRYRTDNKPAYNEKRTIEEFQKLWNIPIPYSSNLFVEIKK